MRRIVSFWDVLPLYETHRCLTTCVIVSILCLRGRVDRSAEKSEYLKLPERLTAYCHLAYLWGSHLGGEKRTGASDFAH